MSRVTKSPIPSRVTGQTTAAIARDARKAGIMSLSCMGYI